MAELTFEGFPPATFAWFRELAENNERAWFEANRATFEAAVRDPLAALMADAAATFGGTLKLARPQRDVRFSPDKRPYKQNLFGVVHSRPGTDAGLYASVSAEGVMVGTGYWEMASDQLARFRAAIATGGHGPALADAVDTTRRTLEVRGRSLKTAPRGVAKDHPFVAFLRMKELIAIRTFSPDACGSAGLAAGAFTVWREAAPVVDWLDAHVGPSELSPAERFGREGAR